jgi:hypothetical protein
MLRGRLQSRQAAKASGGFFEKKKSAVADRVFCLASVNYSHAGVGLF